MPIVVTAGPSGAKSEPVPAGTHHAICYGVVDLGTQISEKFGPKRKLALLWEIPDERITIREKNLPRGISKRFTASLNEKGNLRKALEGWRGRPFTKEELGGFDLTNLLGKNCLLNVIHVNGARGAYSEIAGVVAIPKGMPLRKAENELTNYSIIDAIAAARKAGQKDVVWPESLPQWISDVCSKSTEYTAFASDGTFVPAPEPVPEPDPIGEDVPF